MHWIALPLPGPDDTAALDAAGLQAANWWALQFTPRVALVDGEALLLEVSTTERLWGGRQAVQRLVLQAWAEAASALRGDTADGTPPDTSPHTSPPWGCGPTALVAQAWLRMAQAGRSPAGQGGAVERLPLHTLTALRPHVASLERMGCRTWGALRALPRAGVARRIGAAALHALDQALGGAPEAHAWLELPEQFVLAVELPALAESADALLWSTSRCLTALQGWLQARQQGALALELMWRHDLRRIDGRAIAPTQALAVRTAQPTQDMAHLRRLLSENLARTTLAAPANHIRLRLLESAPLTHRSASLLPPGDRRGLGDAGGAGGARDGAQGEALHQLLERLSARLGADHVRAPQLQADHRPERMQQWGPAAEVLRHPAQALSGASPLAGAPSQLQAPHVPDATLWPTWLLRPPRRLAVQGNRPCHHGLLSLLAGPHRFEAGWWSARAEDGMSDGSSGPAAQPCASLALRDYFVAHNDVVGLVWVFRERLPPQADHQPAAAGRGAGAGASSAAPPQRWFLHGIFG